MATSEAQAAASAGRARLTTGPVWRHLVNLGVPMAWGIFAVIAFNVVDTYFVGQLGTEPLAALAFTFPVAMTVTSLAIGLGIGTASVLARAIGSADESEVRRLTTDSLLLSTLLVTALAIIGILTIDPLFALIGAGPDTLPLLREYMVVWYIGMPMLVVPMIGNFAMRAWGDALFPSLLMTISAIINGVLDPFLIFGWWVFPELGIQGAAYASLVARTITLIAAIAILHGRMRMIDWHLPRPGHLWASARQIGHIAGPAAATNVINPLANGLVTAFVAGYGSAAVAGFGVATRIEALALIPMLALTAGLGPIVGQNWGADERERVHLALRQSAGFCLFWGAGIALVMALLARPLAGLFDEHAETIDAAVLYLHIVPASFAAYGVLICVNSAMNAAGKPLVATALMVSRTFLLYVPLAWLGAQYIGLWAIFAAGLVASLITGGLAWVQRGRLL